MAWTLNSHEKLAAAGYLFRKCVDCRRCGVAIAIYGTPEGHAIGIDRRTFEPHRKTCAALKKKPGPRSGNLFGEPLY